MPRGNKSWGDMQSPHLKSPAGAQLTGGFEVFMQYCAASIYHNPFISFPSHSVPFGLTNRPLTHQPALCFWECHITYTESQAVLWSHQRGQPGAAPLRISQRWLCECRVSIFSLYRLTGFKKTSLVWIFNRHKNTTQGSLYHYDDFDFQCNSPEVTGATMAFTLQNYQLCACKHLIGQRSTIHCDYAIHCAYS